MADRSSAGDSDRELAMLAQVRAHLREAEGPGFKIPTRVVDEVLDERNQQRRNGNGDGA